MRTSTSVAAILLLCATAALASRAISADDAEAMRIEALVDRAPERIQGRFEFILEDPDVSVDATSGSGGQPDDDCAKVPVRVMRGDGVFVTRQVNTCD